MSVSSASECRFSWHLEALRKSTQLLKQGGVLLDWRILHLIHEAHISIHC